MKRMWSKNELAKQVKEVKKDITTLVDAQGHPRFIEGDIEIETITGVTKSYGKWSLSGTHLMIVITLNLANAADFEYQRLAYVGVPAWVISKIVPVSTNYVIAQKSTAYDSDLASQSINTYLLTNGTQLWVDIAGATLTADRVMRIQFDLLIDNA